MQMGRWSGYLKSEDLYYLSALEVLFEIGGCYVLYISILYRLKLEKRKSLLKSDHDVIYYIHTYLSYAGVKLEWPFEVGGCYVLYISLYFTYLSLYFIDIYIYILCRCEGGVAI